MDFVGSMMPYFRPNFNNMSSYLEEHRLRYKHALCVMPTGWADSSNWNRKKAYSEKDNLAVQVRLHCAQYRYMCICSRSTVCLSWTPCSLSVLSCNGPVS